MFHTPGPMGLIIIAAVVLILFGRGKVSNLMGEVGKGISSFKKGIKDGADEAERTDTAAKEIPAQTGNDKV